MTITERTWNSEVIGWIQEAIKNGQTSFQDATTEVGISIQGQTTRYPDVLLILNKKSFEIFNGWELKFPDVAVDDPEMLENALLKAKQIQSNSFVTWNGSQARIWKINSKDYRPTSLEVIRDYPPEPEIRSRTDLSNPANYSANRQRLRERLMDILHDLEQFKSVGYLRPALNINNDIVGAISETADKTIPLLDSQIRHAINTDPRFREQFGRWKILEGSTIKILSHSSRRLAIAIPTQVLARFMYYKIIGKVIFYKTLAENLAGRIPPLQIDPDLPIQRQLQTYFARAQEIDYQAVFEPDFTDDLVYSADVDRCLRILLNIFSDIDFRYIPTVIIGFILENLVPIHERQKFGQYFTSEKLAYLVTAATNPNGTSIMMDPTSGTGTFLSAFYQILKYRGTDEHNQLLDQVWGNDISHFPALLSVINLYKQNLTIQNNFPRVTRSDFFRLYPGQMLRYPDPVNLGNFLQIELPQFDAIVSNFPFIQQEDIPKDDLRSRLEIEFGDSQPAFNSKGAFTINERSDYYTYCFYNSLKFLKDGGCLAAITPNAWLTKNYGTQFKRFLLHNFTIKMIVRSSAEHWFQDSKVSTIYTVLKKGPSDEITRFVTIHFKLDDYFPGDPNRDSIGRMEDLYNEIYHCNLPYNENWTRNEQFPNLFERLDGMVTVSLVTQDQLIEQIHSQQNWAINFLSANFLSPFEGELINPFPDIIDTGRGTRANTDDFQILDAETARAEGIEGVFLIPAIKSSKELSQIFHSKPPTHYIFSCDRPIQEIQREYPGAYRWIRSFEQGRNKKGILYPLALAKKKPYWYSLIPEEAANIFISIGPGSRLFFSYSPTKVYLNQRLVAIRVADDQVTLIAALFNCIITLLMVELNGIPRAEGVLDLNADFFKSRVKILNPDLLTDPAKNRIIEKFLVVANRSIEKCDIEFTLEDRLEFDRQVFQEFGFDIELIPLLYQMLIRSVADRENMKDK